MKMNAYSIWDKKVNAGNVPFFQINHAACIRTLSAMVNNGVNKDNGMTIATNPEDFVLFQVGTWDDQDMDYTATHPPLKVLELVELIEE